MGEAGDFLASFDLNQAGGIVPTAGSQVFTIGTEDHGSYPSLVGEAGDFLASYHLNQAGSALTAGSQVFTVGTELYGSHFILVADAGNRVRQKNQTIAQGSICF